MNERTQSHTLRTICITALVTALIFSGITWLVLRGAQSGRKPASDPTLPSQQLTESKDTATTDGTEAEAVNYQDKINEIQSYIDYYYIGEVDNAAMGDAVAEGMIKGLGDEWSYYIPASEYASFEEAQQNSYVGIGVTITSENVEKGLLITDVVPDSPAYQAGLRIDDLIVAVEGVPVLDGSEEAIDINETKNRVRGPEGTSVTITVSRDGKEQDYTIVRATIKTVNVTAEPLENGLYYIRIKNFEKDAAQDTIAAIEQAQDAGAKGVIFDVRYNPGGYKHELVALLDYILPEGPLFRSVDYRGVENVDESDAAHIEIPMAVLVNYNSYSAAEFFAAALQEYGVAKIVGEQTYGKGRFQTAFRLSDGSAINISIGQYTTPNGVSLVGKGITPDYPVDLTDEQKLDLYYSKLSKEDDEQLKTAISVLTSDTD